MEKIYVDELNYATDGSAGLDIPSAEDFIIAPHGMHIVSTNLYLRPRQEDKNNEDDKYPKSISYFEIAGRSSLAVKMITAHPGIIDMDYPGEIKVVLFNLSPNEFKRSKGDNIAQLVCKSCVQIKKPQSVQRTGGFGSTGN